MSWLTRQRVQLYLRNSMWLMPSISIVIALVFVRILHRIEVAFDLHSKFGRDIGIVVLGTIAGSTFTLVVVFASAILVAVQLASAQLTPRIISLVYRTGIRKFSLSLFVFTFTFSVAAMLRLGETVPMLTGYVAAYTFLFNLVLFIHFIERMGKSLRPSSALQTVGSIGREVIHSVYPRLLSEHDLARTEPLEHIEAKAFRTVVNLEDGAVLAFDLKGLMSLAQRSNCIIEMVPAVGDFIAEGDPLFHIYEGGTMIPEETFRNSVAIGAERTMEQDPMFAFRIIVDIASKALSPAINDPTTAVLAVDQLHHLLRDVGKRYLAEGHEKDSAGTVRLIYRRPYWEDFVQLSLTEIRQYGRDSIQVMRRLRAMLEDLIATLPACREPLLTRELSLLLSSSKRVFPDLADQELAGVGDLQGMGGAAPDEDHVVSNLTAS
jgi:uncharacterized membrane protein